MPALMATTLFFAAGTMASYCFSGWFMRIYFLRAALDYLSRSRA